MGGWDTVIVFVAYTALVSAVTVADLTKNHLELSSPPITKDYLNLFKTIPIQASQPLYDQIGAESYGTLFNNIYWGTQMKVDPNLDTEHSTVPRNISENSELPISNNQEHKNYRLQYNDYNGYIDHAALEKEAEAFVERQFNQHQQDTGRSRRQNADEDSQVNPQPVIPAEDNHGESSDYGHESYVKYVDEHDSHKYEEYQPKKNEIHYHQHKHLHEHDHLQEHKHQHLNDHREGHRHEHNAHADHKHQHHQKHEHNHKAEHYHKLQANHKHEHYQDHKHNHKNEHKHDHQHGHKHEHWQKHGHEHKQDHKHSHESKHKHDHNSHHEHKVDAKHHHNHWSDNKHWHDHHHDNKHQHEHKNQQHHKHHSKNGYNKVKVYYKKGHKHSW